MSNKLLYSKRSRCQGCVALICGVNSFICDLGFPIEVKDVQGTAVAPKPAAGIKCYKPKSVKQQREAREAVKKKQKD